MNATEELVRQMQYLLEKAQGKLGYESMPYRVEAFSIFIKLSEQKFASYQKLIEDLEARNERLERICNALVEDIEELQDRLDAREISEEMERTGEMPIPLEEIKKRTATV